MTTELYQKNMIIPITTTMSYVATLKPIFTKYTTMIKVQQRLIHELPCGEMRQSGGSVVNIYLSTKTIQPMFAD